MVSFGNVNNVKNVPQPAGQGSSAVSAQQSQTNTPVVLNLEEILKQMGITLEDYQNMSPVARKQLVDDYNAIKSENNMTGLVVERTGGGDAMDEAQSTTVADVC